MSTSDIAHALRVDYGRAKHALDELAADGLVVRQVAGADFWQRTRAGKRRVDAAAAASTR
jgi:DNA-binding MarR family transcriptional regulator